METENAWNKFFKSGLVDDYLSYVNICKEYGSSEGNRNEVYNGSFGYRRDERGRE